MSISTKALKNTPVFESITVGKNQLAHRIVLAPSTRFRALSDHTPSDLNLQFYDDRSKVRGSLLITEATAISQGASGYSNTPGIWSGNHIKAWSEITKKVHGNGSFISLQSWACGRVADPKFLKGLGLDLVGPSTKYESEESEKLAIAAGNPIRELSEQELHEYVFETYTNAAKNAMKAGFDYFELHGANGYLLDQFWHPCTNVRTDKYGGSIENRARFFFELLDHLIEVIGADKIGVRLSPWSTFQGILSVEDLVHPLTTFSYIAHELQKRAKEGNQVAYVSLVEPRAALQGDELDPQLPGSNDFFYDIWKGTIIRAGGYGHDTSNFTALLSEVENGRTLFAFARDYTSNPDLPEKLKNGYPLNPYDRTTFYGQSNWGYNTFNRAGENNHFDQDLESKKSAKEITFP